jgi:MFS family permease
MSASFLNTMFYTGSIFAAWLTFAMVYYNGSDASWSWKIPNFIQGFGPVLLLSAFIVPESPRWLIKNGKEHKAHAILARFHANGDLQDPLVLQQIVDIKAALDLEIIAKSSKWIDFVKTPGNRRRALIIISIALSTQLSGNGVVQYFLVPVLRQAGITLPAQTAGINGGLAVWNWFASMLGASLVERAGRRTLVLTSSAGMLACFIVITALSGGYAQTHHAALGISIVPFIFFFMAFYSVALTPLPYLYIPEISSLSMRAKSIALLITTTNICLAFNNFVNPIALAGESRRFGKIADIRQLSSGSIISSISAPW